MGFLERKIRHYRWSRITKISDVAGDDFVAVALLSQTPELQERILAEFTPNQSARVKKLVRGGSFPSRLGALVLGEFLNIEKASTVTDDEFLSLLCAALQAYIETDLFRAARSLEKHFYDWRPERIAEARPGPYTYENFSAEEKTVLVARSLSSEALSDFLSVLDSAASTNFSYADVHLPPVRPLEAARVLEELSDRLGGEREPPSLSPAETAQNCMRIWPQITCPHKAAENEAKLKAERGPVRINPLIRRMFERPR